MKSTPFALFLVAGAVLTARADDVLKADNTDALHLETSWSGGVVPGAADVAVWDSTVTAARVTDLGADLALAGVRVASPGGAVTVNGTQVLSLGGSGIDLSAASQNLNLNSALTLTADQQWTVGSGRTLQVTSGVTRNIVLNGDLTLAGSGTVAFGGSVANSNPVLSGAGDIIINGATLRNDMQGGGSSTGRTGDTILNSGTLAINSSVSLFGTGKLVLNGGAIGSGTTTSRTIANALVIGGNFRVGGTGLNTGAIHFQGAVDLNGGVRTIEGIPTALISNVGTGTILSGVVSNGGIVKTGTGHLVLSNNANTFTGPVTVNAGLLAIGKTAIANSVSTTLAANGTGILLGENGPGSHLINNLNGVAGTAIRSDYGLSGASTTRSLTIRQSVDGEFAGSFVQGSSRAFEVVKTGSATLTLSGPGGHSLGTTISDGTLKIGGGGLLGAATYAGAVVNNATLQFDSTANQSLTGTMSGSGALVKSGTGALTLAGDGSAFSGASTVSAGSLFINGSLGAGGVTVGAAATIGGSGVLGGALAMDSAAFLQVVDIADPLAVAGSVTFGPGFGFANLKGWDYAAAELGTYTLISGDGVDLTGLSHVGPGNALDLGGGRAAYFQQGSLQVVIIPEPSAPLLLALGSLVLLGARRRR